MDEDYEPPPTSTAASNSLFYYSDVDSACSTPYVSAPSSPGRSSSATSGGATFFYSAPASPMHFFLSSSAASKPSPAHQTPVSASFEFEEPTVGSMTSADELFLNGQIRPMKLSSHLQRPQTLAPLLDLDESDEKEPLRGRESKARDRRRTRSLSPLRGAMTWHEDKEKCEIKEEEEEETEASMSASSSRSSSGSRSSKRWIFLKEFLYRSKSEGRNKNDNNRIWEGGSNKFWNNFSFSPIKDKKEKAAAVTPKSTLKEPPVSSPTTGKKKAAAPTNGVGKRRVATSAHERHYKANRAQAEEMRKKTFLPYRQGLIGCLGFSSKSYGAVNGLARALNPVSSR